MTTRACAGRSTDWSQPTKDDGSVIDFYSFETRKVTQFAKAPRAITSVALTPDGRQLLYVVRDRHEYNNVLVEYTRL